MTQSQLKLKGNPTSYQLTTKLHVTDKDLKIEPNSYFSQFKFRENSSDFYSLILLSFFFGKKETSTLDKLIPGNR